MDTRDRIHRAYCAAADSGRFMTAAIVVTRTRLRGYIAAALPLLRSTSIPGNVYRLPPPRLPTCPRNIHGSRTAGCLTRILRISVAYPLHVLPVCSAGRQRDAGLG